MLENMTEIIVLMNYTSVSEPSMTQRVNSVLLYNMKKYIYKNMFDEFVLMQRKVQNKTKQF